MGVKENPLLPAREMLQEIESACTDFGLNTLNKTLQSVKKFTQQHQYLDIAVLGQFKSGKSSLLNGLIGKNLLPVGNIPVTSVITRLRFGPEEKALVSFLDGTVKPIPIQKISEYVSESENPENRKNALFVDIETPSLSGMKEIRLVDTPGIGSVWKHNTETTRDWFPETGGVLFLISAEKPMSESELSLLKEIYLYSPEITIVITKTDLFKEEQIREIESFTKQVLKKAFDRDFSLMKYSAYRDTAKYNREIVRSIFLPLARNRSATYEKILRHKIETTVNACLSYLNISYQASLKKEAEKNTLKGTILDEHLNARFIRQELLLIIGSYKEKTRDSFKAYLDSFGAEIKKKIIKDYERVFASWNGNLYMVTRQFEGWLKQSLDDELKEILFKEDKSFELLNAVKRHLAFYLKSFRERLSEKLDRVLGVKIKAEEWEIITGELKKPDISVGRSFDFHLDMLWFLFPMFIYKKFFHRFFLKQIPGEIEKNLHRLTSDLTEKTNREMDHFMEQALGYINEELRTIERLLSQDKGDSAYLLKRMDSLKHKFHSLSYTS